MDKKFVPPVPKKYNPVMSSVIEESEPDSSFKETVKNKHQRPSTKVPEIVDELPPDREDEISDDDAEDVTT